MPRNALVCQVVLHTNEAFTKGQGILGGNPGSRASFRIKRDTDAAKRFAGGAAPVALDDLAGDEEPVVFKGAPVDAGPADVWEWTSPSTGGYGDPLRRDPDAVLVDVVAQRLDAATAQRAYGVVVRDGTVDPDATLACRAALLRARLGGREPGAEVPAPEGARPVGDLLHILDGRWWCNGRDLGPAVESYRAHTLVRETPARSIAPEFDALDVELADQIVLREYLCPVTGYRIDAELARAGEPVLQDMRIHV
jgi:N-methylhydantoinase B